MPYNTIYIVTSSVFKGALCSYKLEDAQALAATLEDAAITELKVAAFESYLDTNPILEVALLS